MDETLIKEFCASLKKGTQVKIQFYLENDGVVPKHTICHWTGEIRSVIHGKIWILWQHMKKSTGKDQEVWIFPFPGMIICQAEKYDPNPGESNTTIVHSDTDDDDSRSQPRKNDGKQKKGRIEEQLNQLTSTVMALSQTVMQLTEVNNSQPQPQGTMWIEPVLSSVLQPPAAPPNGKVTTRDPLSVPPPPLPRAQGPIREPHTAQQQPHENQNPTNGITPAQAAQQQASFIMKEGELADAIISKNTRKMTAVSEGLRVPATVEPPFTALYPNLWKQDQAAAWKACFVELLLHLGAQIQAQSLREEYELARDTLILLGGESLKAKSEWKVPFFHAFNIARILILTTQGAVASQKCRTKLLEQWLDGRVDFETAMRAPATSENNEPQQSTAVNQQMQQINQNMQQINQFLQSQGRGNFRQRGRRGFFRGRGKGGD